VEFGRTPFTPCTFLSVGGTPFTLLRLLCVPFRGRRVFRCAFPLARGLVTLLRRGDSVRLGFLVMSGDLAALPLALELAFATPSFDRSSDPKRYQRYGNHDGDDDDD
jgi:hypothetical protein